MKYYNIDYRYSSVINIEGTNSEQVALPIFQVIETKKNLDSVNIKCMQLHHLDGEFDIVIVPDDVEAPVISGMFAPFTTLVGDIFIIPPPSVTDNLDTDPSVTTQYTGLNQHATEEWGDNEYLATSAGTITVLVTAEDASGNISQASSYIEIQETQPTISRDGWMMNRLNEGYTSEYELAWGIAGNTDWDLTNFQSRNECFWFATNLENDWPSYDAFYWSGANFAEEQMINGDNQIGEILPNIGNGMAFYQVVQVSGFPNDNDNGLYRVAGIGLEEPLGDWYDTEGYYFEWINTFLLFQKVNMDLNNIDEFGEMTTVNVGSYPVASGGDWLDNLTPDEDHEMSSPFVENYGTPINEPYGEEFDSTMPPLIQDLASWPIDEAIGGCIDPPGTLTFTNIPTESLAFVDTLMGDVNLDGFVNVLDIVGYVGYILDAVPTPSSEAGMEYTVAMDINQDGSHNILDIVALVNGILEGFPDA